MSTKPRQPSSPTTSTTATKFKADKTMLTDYMPLYSIHTADGGDNVLTLDTDSFIVGDRVWVNGVRPGHIAFIGETHFAPGEWAGVALDDPTGKNDGSVSGRRYFYCAPYKGIFARLWRLTRYPLIPDAYRSSSPVSYTRSTSRTSGILRSVTPDRQKTYVTTFRSGSPSRSMSSASSRVESPTRSVTFDSSGKTVTTVTTTTTTDPLYKPGPMRIGDKVVVDSSKGMLEGRLRFLGHTDFAPGYWAGVELDEPMGKNDGTVAGKRYFWCPNYYGMFAPAWKVMKADPKRMTTVTRISRSSPEI